MKAIETYSAKIRHSRGIALWLASLVVLGVSETWAANSLDLSGWASVDLRWYPDEAQFSGQSEDRAVPSVVLAPNLSWSSERGDDEIRFTPFVRVDSVQDERTHNDIREFIWNHFGNGWDLNAGIGKAYWGAAESWPLTDVITQIDRVEDVLGREHLGQPMVRLSLYRDFGKIDIYMLPYFRERTFSGKKDRLRLAIPVSSNAEYESSAEDNHVDFAVRWEGSPFGVDMGVGYFRGTSRDPQLVPSLEGQQLKVTPFYWQMNQVSVDTQWSHGAWLWKFEGLYRDTGVDDFGAAIVGFEYSQGKLFDSSANINWLVEYIYDARDTDLFPTPVENDLFLGARIQLNNSNDTSAVVGAFIDTDTQATFMGARAEHRIADGWKLEINALLSTNEKQSDVLAPLSQDGYLEARLFRYF